MDYWTEAEDNRLSELCESGGKTWLEISEVLCSEFPDFKRTPDAAEHRARLKSFLKPQPPRTTWPSAADMRLKELWASGLRAMEIAWKLHAEFQFRVTKNAVIGKANRLGCPPRKPTATSPEVIEKRLAIRAERARQKRKSIMKYMGNKFVQVDVTAPVHVVEVENFTKTLMDLGVGDCRYPSGGNGEAIFFCGEPKLWGYSYCPHHYQKCRVWR